MCLSTTLTPDSSRLKYLPLGTTLIKNYVSIYVGRNLKCSALSLRCKSPLKQQTYQQIPEYFVDILNWSLKILIR